MCIYIYIYIYIYTYNLYEIALIERCQISSELAATGRKIIHVYIDHFFPPASCKVEII